MSRLVEKNMHIMDTRMQFRGGNSLGPQYHPNATLATFRVHDCACRKPVFKHRALVRHETPESSVSLARRRAHSSPDRLSPTLSRQPHVIVRPDAAMVMKSRQHTEAPHNALPAVPHLRHHHPAKVMGPRTKASVNHSRANHHMAITRKFVACVGLGLVRSPGSRQEHLPAGRPSNGSPCRTTTIRAFHPISHQLGLDKTPRKAKALHFNASTASICQQPTKRSLQAQLSVLSIQVQHCCVLGVLKPWLID